MFEVSADYPSRKERRSSNHVIDATDASSSTPLKDTTVSNVSASPWNAPSNRDIGTNGKKYKVNKTVFESRDAAARDLEGCNSNSTDWVYKYWMYSALDSGCWILNSNKAKQKRPVVQLFGMLKSWRMQQYFNTGASSRLSPIDRIFLWCACVCW